MRRRPRERAVTAIQVAMAMPSVLFLLLATVQFAFYEFAGQVALSAAQQGLVAATVQGGTPAAAKSAALTVVTQQGKLLGGPVATVSESGGTVTVEVTGTAMQILPGLSLPVDRTAAGPMEPTP